MQMAALEPCDGSLMLGLGRHDSEWRYQVLLGYGRYCAPQPPFLNSPTHLGGVYFCISITGLDHSLGGAQDGV